MVDVIYNGRHCTLGKGEDDVKYADALELNNVSDSYGSIDSPFLMSNGYSVRCIKNTESNTN